MSEATLKDGEYHPVADSAMFWLRELQVKRPADYSMACEAIYSTAISGNRTAELCASTLDRLLIGESVSDRYLLALCWLMRGMVDDVVLHIPEKKHGPKTPKRAAI